MIFTKLTKKALRLSFAAHKNQQDKSGMPYVYHPYRVAQRQTDEYAVCTALLHDVLEDTKFTAEDLRREGFPAEVIQAVCAMTHPEQTPYMDYVRAIKQNPIAARVKLADLRNNSNLNRLDAVDDAAFRRVAKYAQAQYILLDRQNRNLAEKAEEAVQTVISQAACCRYRAYALGHAQLVFQFAVLLAMRRGEKYELAAVAGWLHDVHTFATGDGTDHGPKGAEMLAQDENWRHWLSEEELLAVCQMIRHHSAKERLDAPLDECLKDADVLAHYLEMQGQISGVEQKRFAALCRELGVQGECS